MRNAKKIFMFRKNGVTYTDPDLGEGWKPEELSEIMEERNKFYSSQKPNERSWRNYELTNTDWMLVPDATYAGELLAGSQRLTDIMDYRNRLREYNLTTEDRPSRPEWFNG